MNTNVFSKDDFHYSVPCLYFSKKFSHGNTLQEHIMAGTMHRLCCCLEPVHFLTVSQFKLISARAKWPKKATTSRQKPNYSATSLHSFQPNSAREPNFKCCANDVTVLLLMNVDTLQASFPHNHQLLPNRNRSLRHEEHQIRLSSEKLPHRFKFSQTPRFFSEVDAVIWPVY